MLSWIKFCPLFIFYTAYTHAAALDKSGQSITAFLEQGHYTELAIGQVQGNIVGEIPHRDTLLEAGVNNFSTENLMPDYLVTQAAIKLQLHPHISVALLYDQPFGAEVGYALYQPNTQQKTRLESTYLDLQTESLSFLLGFQPSVTWNFFTGLNYQTLEGQINLDGKAFSVFDGYQATIKEDHAVGAIAGISYQIPEYALKSTLTYRSKIRYQPMIEESIANQTLAFSPESANHIETPQSVNLDFQMGIMPKTLLYGSVRWVDWSNFSVQPTQFDAVTQAILALLQMKQDLNLIDYQHDQWSGTVGLAWQISDQWAMSADAGWDSGTGNPASTLGPIDSLYKAGLNARYQLNPKTFVVVGMKYLWLNPAHSSDVNTLDVTQQMTSLTQSAQNNAFAYGFKIGHYF